MVMAKLEQEATASTEIPQLPTPPPEVEDSTDAGIHHSGAQGSSVSKNEDNIPGAPPLIEVSTGDSQVDTKTDSDLKTTTPVITEAKATQDSKKEADSANKQEVEKTDKKEDSKSDDETKTEETKKDDTKKEDEKKKKALPRGMKADAKTLWAKTDALCKCCTTWVEENPDTSKDPEASDDTVSHAIVVRKKKKHEGNRKPLKVDSIVIHSPLVKVILQKVFTGYPDLVIDLDELIFDAPFAPFFHRWEAFKTAVNEEKDDRTSSHLRLLYDALDLELQKPIQRHKDLVRSKAIDFDLLWTLYTPGSLMYSHDEGHDRLYETKDCEYWQDISGMKFTVRCDAIDWDGTKYGRTSLSENIPKFKGTKKITTLPSYPLVFHPKADEMKFKCIERGRRFQELSGVSCQSYKGVAVQFTQYSLQIVRNKRALDGRIMLDEEQFSKALPEEAVFLTALDNDVEDAAKAELETSERLAEQSKKAIEQLKKVEIEIKKEEEDEAKQKELEAKKKDSGKDDKDVKTEKLEEKKAEESSSTPDTEKLNTPSEDETSSSPKSEAASQTENQEEVVGLDKSEAHEEKPSLSGLKEDENIKVLSPCTSTDSEGLPTPASEDEVEDVTDFSSSEKQELTDDQLAICTSWLRGYSLNDQKWCSFAVSNVTDVAWNDNAFSELTLPSEYRELILATIQSQIRQNRWKQKMEKAEKEQKPLSTLSRNDAADEEDDPAQFDDFIAQKGLGYIMLFSGNPGVGKTATAESIAELLHVPLCIVSSGTLGTSAESVESALQDVLELASKWNAVLLLDEADIFLEQRTKHDLHRNAVVSVFLRLLEYYQGVLCLTTNRPEEIDVAFHSRIHLSLPFEDLNETNREQIWRHFANMTNKKHEAGIEKREALNQIHKLSAGPTVEKSATPETAPSTTAKTTVDVSANDECHNEHSLIQLSNSDFRKLSQTPLNGRQIKNAFKTSVLLASYKKEKVQMKHVKTALRTIDGNGLGKREVGRMYY